MNLSLLSVLIYILSSFLNCSNRRDVLYLSCCCHIKHKSFMFMLLMVLSVFFFHSLLFNQHKLKDPKMTKFRVLSLILASWILSSYLEKCELLWGSDVSIMLQIKNSPAKRFKLPDPVSDAWKNYEEQYSSISHSSQLPLSLLTPS